MSRPERAPRAGHRSRQAFLASDPERDAVLSRLRDAYAAGRLSDDEFGARMHAAIRARTWEDLAGLLAGLPKAGVHGAPAGAALPRPGRVAAAIMGTVCRTGRWRVPPRFTVLAYRGIGILDLRAADLSSATTVITALAYRSRITIVVPPGTRLVARGPGVTTGGSARWDALPLPIDAPVVEVHGYSVRGVVEAGCRPPAA